MQLKSLKKRYVFFVLILCVPALVYGATMTETTSVTGGVSILGALSKGSGTFVIDHPLDPRNKLLYHSFVESPDVKNIYDGIAILDEHGVADIELPSYFLALNTDFRYLATPVDGPMPDLYLAREIRERYFNITGGAVFTIAGGAPHGTVSWQVTGIRHDPFILDNPIVPEVEKGTDSLLNKGECIFEPLCK